MTQLPGGAGAAAADEVQGLGNPGRQESFASVFHSFSRGGPACTPTTVDFTGPLRSM